MLRLRGSLLPVVTVRSVAHRPTPYTPFQPITGFSPLLLAAAGEDADYPSDTGAEDDGSGSVGIGSSSDGVVGSRCVFVCFSDGKGSGGFERKSTYAAYLVDTQP